MPILYRIDINFNIAISDFTGVANISSTSNYIKAQNKANKEGTNNNSKDSPNNNSKDNNNREDISGIKTQKK